MAAALSTKVNRLLSSVPVFLSWPRFGLRRISTSRSASFASEPSAAEAELPVPPRKVLEAFTEEFEIGSRKITFETGKIARFANGAVVMAIDDTKVLSTVASAKSDGVRDFLPFFVCTL